MAIRFYMNGTEGATDGTEISNGDLTNPLVADGFYPAAGTTVSKNIDLMLRADAGETWKCVITAVGSSTTNELSKFALTQPNGNYVAFYNSSTNAGQLPFYAEVKDVNQKLTLTVSASGDENNSPDTTQKLIVVGGIQIA